MALPHFRLVTFDLDGTLVDTACEIVESCNRALADFDVAARPDDQVIASIGRGTLELIRQQRAQVLEAAPDLAERLPLEALYARFQIHYAAISGTTGRPYAGCVAALKRLRAAGVQCACVTNKETRFALQVLDGTGLREFFPIVIGGDSFAFKKPDPRVLQAVLEPLGVAAESAGHVGDSSIDVDTARNAGVSAWAVPYGYNHGIPIADSCPDRIFASLDELALALVNDALPWSRAGNFRSEPEAPTSAV